jgi:hypothetical protein
MSTAPDSPREDDPLGLDKVEREIRIEKLRREIDDIAGGQVVSGKSPDCDPELEEAFLQNVLDVENHGFVRPFDVLVRDGFSLPSPAELDPATLTEKLWELIRALAARRLYLHNTNHLSDHALYSWLCEHALREEMMGFGLPFGNCHLDVIGSGSDEDITLGLRYYDDEKRRAQWAVEFPDFPMPAHEDPPYDRDRHLPQPSEPIDEIEGNDRD